MGVTTQNLPLATARQYVDKWRALGVTGIFWDDVGTDMGVDRARQNTLIDYTHTQGLVAFVNAWNPADVFAVSYLGGATWPRATFIWRNRGWWATAA